MEIDFDNAVRDEAEMHCGTGNYLHAEAAYIRLLGLEKLKNRKSVSVARTLFNLSRVYEQMGRYSAAVTMAQGAIDVLEEISPNSEAAALVSCHMQELRRVWLRGFHLGNYYDHAAHYQNLPPVEWPVIHHLFQPRWAE
jgi:tetratricopeptide (TPR) repeat protein